MQNLYIVRTATVVSLTAAFVTLGWMSLQGDDLQVAPEQIAVAAAQAEPGMHFQAAHFHDGFVLQANDAEPEVHEYY
jgi:hypothetical protein